MTRPDQTDLETNEVALKEILKLAETLLSTSLTMEQEKSIERIRQLAGTILDRSPMEGFQAIPSQEQEENPAGHPKVGDNLRILVVEDNPFTQKLLTRLLEMRGHGVTLASNGIQAQEALRKASYDLALMDLRMPEMDGFQATMAIRQKEAESRSRHLPIIAVTALLGDENRQRALEAGLDGFHGKPIQAEALFGEINRVLTLSRPPTPEAIPSIEEVEADIQRLLETVDGDIALFKEVGELYFNDAPRQMALIREGVSQQNALQVGESAHSLKGASGAFGMESQVYKMALAIEKLGKSGELQKAESLYDNLGKSLKILESVFNNVIHGQEG
ncbi:MAG: response regulator [Magnetococcales bacterium]|nr:response regulator [Magnetococcales bacterium]